MTATSTIRVGQIGLGNNGAAFARAYAATPPMKLAAVCDLDAPRAREVAARHDVSAVYTDFREMLASEPIDVVSVHTPDHLHVEPAVLALEMGKHLFCEKPLANDLIGCRRIVDATRRARQRDPRIKTMCGHVLRFNPVLAEVKRLIDQRVLGTLFYLEGDYIHDLRYQSGWNLSEEVPMIGGGCHPIDIMQWWAGPIVQVQAFSNHIAFAGMAEDDCAVAIFRFAGGAIGRCTSAYGPGGPMPKLYNLSAYGTKATVARGEFAKAGEEKFTPLPIEMIEGHPYEPEVQDLAASIVNDRPPRATVEDGARAVAVAGAIQEALRLGRPVPVTQMA
jgi:UDP-N-acetyl-2-amino-2-deoxyglucuronate dehydrogenase